MSHDLTDLLQEWPFQPGEFTAREIAGDDGRPILQVRIDLGLLQMELDGRPDGQRVDGHDSCRAAAGSPRADDGLSRAVRAELSQFDARAQALLMIGEHARAARDADHMLQCARWLAEAGHDHAITQQAASQAALAGKRTDLARLALEGGLTELERVLSAAEYESANEVHLLNGMKDLLVPRLPASQRVELEDRLRAAIAAENYELAAILRDELRMM